MRPKIALSFIIQMPADAVSTMLAVIRSSLKRDTRPFIRALAEHKIGVGETNESLVRKAAELIFPVTGGIAVVSTDTHPDYAAALCVLVLSTLKSDQVIMFGASLTSPGKFPNPVEAKFYAANRHSFAAMKVDDPAVAALLHGELVKRAGRPGREP